MDVGKGSHGGGVSYERWNNVPSILPCPFFRNFIYILVQRNELSQLVEKNKRDEAKIKDLKEQLTKALATAEEHLKKLQEPVPLSAISDIIDKAIEDIPQIESDADGYQEYFSNSIRVLKELKKHKPTWQALQEAIEKLKETVQRLEAEKNKPTT
ncbi:MAG: hypothetical protein H2174_09750 [Vampirovibrio sp.]|nr:hypothetical protein [Vampirovibrio sp.]